MMLVGLIVMATQPSHRVGVVISHFPDISGLWDMHVDRDEPSVRSFSCCWEKGRDRAAVCEAGAEAYTGGWCWHWNTFWSTRWPLYISLGSVFKPI